MSYESEPSVLSLAIARLKGESVTTKAAATAVPAAKKRKLGWVVLRSIDKKPPPTEPRATALQRFWYVLCAPYVIEGYSSWGLSWLFYIPSILFDDSYGDVRVVACVSHEARHRVWSLCGEPERLIKGAGPLWPRPCDSFSVVRSVAEGTSVTEQTLRRGPYLEGPSARDIALPTWHRAPS